MKILIYGVNCSPELTGVGKYTGEMATWLSKHGHEIRVITAPPYYPEWKVRADYSAWRYKRDQIDNCEIYRCPLWVPKIPSPGKRIVHLLSFVLSSLPVLLVQAIWRPAIVIVVAPTLLCAPTGLVVARLARARAWLHIQDFELDIVKELRMIKSKKLLYLVGKLESLLLKRFDRVSTISANMVEVLGEKGVRPEKRVIFPNWVDTRVIQPIDGKNELRTTLGIGEDVIVLQYAGNIGEKQGLDVIIESARRFVTRRDILFVLVGTGAARQRLTQIGHNLTNIRWLPLQPVDKFNELLNVADIHLLPQQIGTESAVMPSKLTGMLASGRPIVAMATGDTSIARAVAGCGLVTQPGDLEAFVEAITELISNKERRIELGRRAREHAVKYLDMNKIMQDFESDMRAMMP